MSVRAPIADLQAGERRLDRTSAHYLVRVLRLRAGDAFVAFDPSSGQEAGAVLIWEDGDSAVVRLEAPRAAAAGPLRPVTWIQGLAKGDKCDAVVRDATELGATRIVVAATNRSVVQLDAGRARARLERWERIAEQAARQCGRADVPALEWVEGLSGALARADRQHADDRSPAAPASAGASRPLARFCLWERASEPLGPVLLEALGRGAPLAFVCGPEGGLEDGEAEVARAAGWALVSLGPLLLRTETVAAAVLGAVRVLGS